MSDADPQDTEDHNQGAKTSTDDLEERGQGAGRLLGEGAEQAFTEDEGEAQQAPGDLPDGSGSAHDHQADES